MAMAAIQSLGASLSFQYYKARPLSFLVFRPINHNLACIKISLSNLLKLKKYIKNISSIQVPRAHGGITKFFVLSDKQSQTQRYFIYNDENLREWN